METFFAFALLVAKMAVVIGVLLALPIPLTWIERKSAGHIQQRLGPMRVGWHGLLQPLADAEQTIRETAVRQLREIFS